MKEAKTQEFNDSLFPELEIPISKQDFGEPDISTNSVFSKIRAYIADNPIAYSISDIYNKLGYDVKEKVDLYSGFNIWVIPTNVNILKDGGITEPVKVGIEIEFRNDQIRLNKGMTCCIVSLLPSSEYTTTGELSGSIFGNISASGEVKPINTPKELREWLPISPNLSVELGTNIKSGLNWKYQVTTPLLSAVGLGSSRAEWVFHEGKNPLHGKDLETWTLLTLPDHISQLEYRVRLYLVLRTAYFPTRRSSDWKTLKSTMKPLNQP